MKQSDSREDSDAAWGLYRQMIESLPEAIFIKSHGQLVFANAAGLALLTAHDANQVINKPFTDFVATSDHEPDEQDVRNGMCGSYMSFKERLMRLDGSFVEIEMKVVPLIDQDEDTVMVVARTQPVAYADVTPTPPLSQATPNNWLEASPDPIIIYDLNGKITYVNRSFERTFGWDKTEVLGQELDFVPEGYRSELTGIVDILINEDHFLTPDTKRCTKDGQILDVQINSALLRNSDGTTSGNILIIRDITDRKRAEGIERQRALQIAALEERHRLARDLHDAVSQTLFSASLMAETLLLQWDENPAETQQSLKRLHQLTQSALTEMRTLLMELRPEALVKANLDELLTNLVNTLAARQQDIEISFTTEVVRLPPDIQISIYRIVQEALTNVFKHAQATRIDLDMKAESDYILITIGDNGIGFDLTASPGRGHFGLDNMRERAASIGAQIQLKSQPGAGTQLSLHWRKDAVG